MLTFTLPDISCGRCVAHVTEAVLGVDPQARVQVDLASKRVEVETTQARDALAAALTEAGYPPA